MTAVPTIDGYTDLVPIGTGGIGDVYRATDSSTGTTVAVKLLRDVTDQSVAWHRTRRELHALRSLGGHPNVIQVVDVLHELPGFVMDYAPGGSVATLVARRGPTIPIPEIVLIGLDTAAALRAAHERGIIHRDVKPQNLLIDAGGRIRLCDFGIASLTRSDEFRTRTSARSMRYASPEDLEEDEPVGPPTDVYSLGATLIHLLHGSPPTLKERLAPWSPRPSEDPVRTDLERIVADCLHPDPDLRPTPGEVVDRMKAVEARLPAPCTGLPILESAPSDGHGTPDDDTARHGARTPQPIVRPDGGRPRPGRRRPLVIAGLVIAGLVFAVLVIAGLVIAGLVDRTTSSTEPPDDVDTILPRPSGMIPLDDPTVIWPKGDTGDCMLQVEGLTTLRVIACERPHDLELFHRGEIDDVGADITPDRLDALVEGRCLAAAPPTDPSSPFRVAASAPSAEAWESGERSFQCFVGIPGRRTTGRLVD